MSNTIPLPRPRGFLDLPAEIRVSIYGYVLIAPRRIGLPPPAEASVVLPQALLRGAAPIEQVRWTEMELDMKAERRFTSSARMKKDRAALDVSLLLVSRLIYFESRAILYGENTFYVSVRSASMTLEHLGASKSFIQHVQVRLASFTDIFTCIPAFVNYTIEDMVRLKHILVVVPGGPYNVGWEYIEMNRKYFKESLWGLPSTVTLDFAPA